MNQFSVLGEQYDDPYLSLQHNLRSMRVPGSHRWATGKGVRVAVIDTGVDVEHEDLKTKVAAHRNFVDADIDRFKDDKHGTAVAGVIVAGANNGKGIAGIAPDARIMAMKGCWRSNGELAETVCSSYTLAKALNAAILAEAERLVKKALQGDVAVVAAVGPNPEHVFPHAIPGVIAVTESEQVADPQTESQSVLNAPGRNIISLSPGNRYEFFSGSSFSTAHVSGLIALIKERKPHLASHKILALLQQNSLQYRRTSGSGVSVNACSTLAQLVGASCTE